MAEKPIEKEKFGIDTEEMAKAGLHFGHKSSKVHPKMEEYLYGMRNTIYIIDLEKTKEKMEEAFEFIRKLISEGKVLLVIGTQIQTKDLVKEFAVECGLPYVSERWIGGTFTNFETIKKRIDYFKELEEKRNKGEIEKYTKKERAIIDSELQDFERKFGGIKNLDKLPDAVLILSLDKDQLAVKEARDKGLTIIGISDTNADPTLADYPIPANDDAISGIQYFLEKLKKVVLKVKKKIKEKE